MEKAILLKCNSTLFILQRLRVQISREHKTDEKSIEIRQK